MGLIPTYLRQLIHLHKRVNLQGPVLTLGSQDVWASHEALKAFFNEAECPYEEAAPEPHSSPLFGKINVPGSDHFVHARTFFGMMGLEVRALDKFSDEGAEIAHDLNDPLPPELCEKFGLVLDG